MVSFRKQSILLINLILTVCVVFVLYSCKENVSLNAPDGLVVILKADDMGDTTPKWNRFIKALNDDSICCGIGIISKNVHSHSIPAIKEIANLKQKNGYPVIEFWNHGYDHFESKTDNKREFYYTSFEYQLEHMAKAQWFFKDSLLLTSHTFGAPYNRTTLLTESSIKHFPEINIWLQFGVTEHYPNSRWKDPKYKVINEIDKRIILSVDYLSLWILNIEEFEHNYEQDMKKPYIIIQIHPAVWSDEIFQKFDSMVHFYKEKHRAIFMTPYQYYEYLHRNNRI